MNAPFLFESYISTSHNEEVNVVLGQGVEGLELVQCSTTTRKTTLFLLNLRFDYRVNSPLRYSGTDFPMEAEKCAKVDYR